MAETRNGEQSMRRAARQAGERDKRLEAAALTLIVTARNATPSSAGAQGG